jgi:hypothetical protein
MVSRLGLPMAANAAPSNPMAAGQCRQMDDDLGVDVGAAVDCDADMKVLASN